MTESSNYDEAANSSPPAYGVWRQVGRGTFWTKYVFYTTKAPEPRRWRANQQRLVARRARSPDGNHHAICRRPDVCLHDQVGNIRQDRCPNRGCRRGHRGGHTHRVLGASGDGPQQPGWQKEYCSAGSRSMTTEVGSIGAVATSTLGEAAVGRAAPHARWVRISHSILTVSVLTLAFTGVVILMAHPRLYWGEAGNDLTPALLELPISRNYQHGGWDAADAVLRGRRGSDQRRTAPTTSSTRTAGGGACTSWPRGGSCCPGACTCWTGSSAATSARTSGPAPRSSRRVSSGATSSITCGSGSRRPAAARTTACCRNARTRSWSSSRRR